MYSLVLTVCWVQGLNTRCTRPQALESNVTEELCLEMMRYNTPKRESTGNIVVFTCRKMGGVEK